MSSMARLSRREVENTRVDMRRWAQQLMELSAEVAERADQIERKDGGDQGEPNPEDSNR